MNLLSVDKTIPTISKKMTEKIQEDDFQEMKKTAVTSKEMDSGD